MADANWIEKSIKRPGRLRRALGTKKGKDIPASKLEAAEKSKNKLTREEADEAMTLRKLRRRKGGMKKK